MQNTRAQTVREMHLTETKQGRKQTLVTTTMDLFFTWQRYLSSRLIGRKKQRAKRHAWMLHKAVRGK